MSISRKTGVGTSYLEDMSKDSARWSNLHRIGQKLEKSTGTHLALLFSHRKPLCAREPLPGCPPRYALFMSPMRPL